jgi:L-histidine N-alpha-methyltransferase
MAPAFLPALPTSPRTTRGPVITVAPPTNPVLDAALAGLTSSPQKTLPPWLFYDEQGSHLFEQITALPEYYLTRTERALFAAHADDIFHEFDAPGVTLTIAELGAGTASKTGLLLQAAMRFQPDVLYQPIDVSPSALDEAAATLTATIPGLTVRPQVANYITEPYTLQRPHSPQQGGRHRILALYIGSSIGNFSPSEAVAILQSLRSRLEPGDALLLGVDLAPRHASGLRKPVEAILAAYDDTAGVTAAFNKNILTRLNRELHTDFNLDAFAHRARWNAEHSRIEMHLESLAPQTVRIPLADPEGLTGLAGLASSVGLDGRAGPAQLIHFARNETIHTESSYKFTDDALEHLLTAANFTPTRTFHDPARTFALTLALAQ